MNLLFDFTVDKETKTIHITREFAADVDLVWDAFTKAEILDQWWAPKPCEAHTKEMNFSEGGHWIYTMVCSGNTGGYSREEFIKIQPKSGFSTKNTFCDENGKSIGDAFSIVNHSFKAEGEKTTVRMEKIFDNLATLEMLVSMGYKEGTASGMENLDAYFLKLAEKK